MDRMAGGQAAAWAPAAGAGDTDRRWWRPDAAIDSQLARPLPPATSAAAAFADMIRRPQSRVQILWLVGFMLVGAGVVSALPAILPGSGTASWSPTKGWAAIVAVQFTWQAAAISLSTTAAMWWQRRDSLALDFLRPVSRRDYWLGLRGAIARDLILSLAVVAAGLAIAATWWGQGRLLPWLVSAVGFGGLVATAHSMLLRGVAGRRSGRGGRRSVPARRVWRVDPLVAGQRRRHPPPRRRIGDPGYRVSTPRRPGDRLSPPVRPLDKSRQFPRA